MKYFYFITLTVLLISCDLERNQAPSEITTTDFSVQNEAEIEEYLVDNNLEAQKSDSGMYYIIDVAGTGAQPNATSNVTVAYKGYFTDGSVFDQSGSEGISFGLQQVIRGWTEGIAYFKEGGSGVLLIPSDLGYGNAGRSGIPGGAVLLFDVSLISVN